MRRKSKRILPFFYPFPERISGEELDRFCKECISFHGNNPCKTDILRTDELKLLGIHYGVYADKVFGVSRLRWIREYYSMQLRTLSEMLILVRKLRELFLSVMKKVEGKHED